MKKEKVVVAISGGVDSSVAALLLKEKGYEVIGLTLKLYSNYYNPLADTQLKDAENICETLKIEHIIIDLKDFFQKKIIDYFKNEYVKGHTPNPCILCNRAIKFDSLLKVANEIGATYIATGHYAIVEKDPNSNIFYLKRAVNKEKDQSYFLYRLNQTILSKTVFPLGTFSKNDIRIIAKKFNIHVHGKEDSNEICFIGDRDYRSFFRRVEGLNKRGRIIYKDGTILGYHNGIFDYTIGQRRGLGISFSSPLYVLSLDSIKNDVIVGLKEDLQHKELIAEDLNWLNDLPKAGEKYLVKIRSIHTPALASVVDIDNIHIKIIFDKPQWAITSGQSVVLYKDDIVLGGGIITHGK